MELCPKCGTKMVFYMMGFNDFACDNMLCSESGLKNKKFIKCLIKHTKKSD